MSNGFAALFMIAAFQTAPARVEITPERAEIEVTETAQLIARALDGAGRVIDGAAVRWIASTPELASVDQSGRVTALNAGMARITVVVGGQPTSVSVVIRALPPAELRVEVGIQEPYAGQVVPLRVHAFNRLGEPVDDPALRYMTSDPACRGRRRGGSRLRTTRGHGTHRSVGCRYCDFDDTLGAAQSGCYALVRAARLERAHGRRDPLRGDGRDGIGDDGADVSRVVTERLRRPGRKTRTDLASSLRRSRARTGSPRGSARTPS